MSHPIWQHHNINLPLCARFPPAGKPNTTVKQQIVPLLFTSTVKDKPILLPIGTDALEALNRTNPSTSVLLFVKQEQHRSGFQDVCLASVKCCSKVLELRLVYEEVCQDCHC